MLFAEPDCAPLVKRKMLSPAVMPACTSSGLKVLMVTLPAGLLTREVNVAPPCASTAMSPAVVFVKPLTTTGPLRLSAIPFAALAEVRIGVVTVTGAPGAPIAPFDELRTTEAPDTAPAPFTLPTDAIVTEPLALTGA